MQLNFPPSGLVRLRLYDPGPTVVATLTDRLSWVALTKVALGVIPAWLATVAPDWKLVPVSVTGALEAPAGRIFGFTTVMVGDVPLATVRQAVQVPAPPEVVTVTLLDPIGAVGLTVTVAVSVVGLTNAIDEAVTPDVEKVTPAVFVKLVPVIVK